MDEDNESETFDDYLNPPLNIDKTPEPEDIAELANSTDPAAAYAAIFIVEPEEAVE